MDAKKRQFHSFIYLKMRRIFFPKQKSINFLWPEELIEVIYASSYEAKPKVLSFYQLKGVEKFISPLYVGDSLTDEQFCKKLNIEFYDIKKIL